MCVCICDRKLVNNIENVCVYYLLEIIYIRRNNVHNVFKFPVFLSLAIDEFRNILK